MTLSNVYGCSIAHSNCSAFRAVIIDSAFTYSVTNVLMGSDCNSSNLPYMALSNGNGNFPYENACTTSFGNASLSDLEFTASAMISEADLL